MKNKIGILMIVAALVLVVSTAFAAAECAGVMGDLNKDGLVNNYDVEAIQKMIAGQDAPDLCGDLDGDSIIAPGDYAKLRILVSQNQNNDVAQTAVSFSQYDGIAKKGDPNNDNKINYQDLGIVKEMVAGIISPSQAADVDGDGYVAPGDVAKIKLMIISEAQASAEAVPTVEQTVVEQEAPACPGIMGDLNKDGLVNNYDVEAIQKMIAGQDAPDLCGDLDGDSIIAPGDYAKLRLLIASGSQASEAGTASALPAADSGISGDANNDGKLDYKDVSLVKEMVAGIIPSNQNADVDGDGIVAPGDVAKIRLMAYQQSHKTENAPIATETEPTITSAAIETNETTNDTNQTVAENQTVGNSTDNPTVDASAPVYTYQLPSNPNCKGMTGDLNKDGVIDELDFEVIKNMISGQETPDMCGDLDLDGIVSPGDYAKLKITVFMDIPRNNITFQPSASLLASAGCGLFGDVNGDGKADYRDVGIMKKMVAGQYPSSKCGDLDGDGYVAPGDISLIKLISAGVQLSCYVTHNCTITNDNGTNQSAVENQTVETNSTINDTNSTGDNSTNETADNSTGDTNYGYPSDYVYHLPYNPNCIGLTGDLNKDGVIDELDLEVMKKMVAGVEAPDMCGDLDLDGYVSPGDIANLKITVFMNIPRWNITFDAQSFVNSQVSADGSIQCGLPGDVNHDGSIDYKDVGIIVKIVAGVYPSSIWADIDGDGIPAPGDVARAKLIAVGAQSYPSIVCYGTNDTNETGNDTNQTNQTNTTNMTVTLTADLVNGTEPLLVNFNCSVQNGTAPYGYGYSITDGNGSLIFGVIAPITESYYSFNETLAAGNWTVSCAVTDYSQNRTAIAWTAVNVYANSTNQTGNSTGNNQTNSTGNQTNTTNDNSGSGHSHGGSGHSGGGSSVGTILVNPNYSNITEVPEQPKANVTVIQTTNSTVAANPVEDKNETVEPAVIASNNDNSYKPSILVIGAVIALAAAALGTTTLYFARRQRHAVKA